jgi:hypothetical protein
MQRREVWRKDILQRWQSEATRARTVRHISLRKRMVRRLSSARTMKEIARRSNARNRSMHCGCPTRSLYCRIGFSRRSPLRHLERVSFYGFDHATVKRGRLTKRLVLPEIFHTSTKCDLDGAAGSMGCCSGSFIFCMRTNGEVLGKTYSKHATTRFVAACTSASVGARTYHLQSYHDSL